MTDQPPSPDDRELEPIDEEQPGSDRGAAYDRVVEEGEAGPPDDAPNGPDVADAFRSGS